MQIGVQLLVRPVIRAADHVRDPEVDVVDDAREMKRRRAVAPPERHALEELLETGRLRRGQVALGALALPHRALVPGDAEPAEVGDDRLLAARDVPRRVGVVDPQQQVVAEAAVRDGAQRVADVQRPGRAGCEPDAGHAVEPTRRRSSFALPWPACVGWLPWGSRSRRSCSPERRPRRRCCRPSARRCTRSPSDERRITSTQRVRRRRGARSRARPSSFATCPRRGPGRWPQCLAQVAALQGKLTTPRAIAVIGQLAENDDWFARRGPPPAPDRRR